MSSSTDPKSETGKSSEISAAALALLDKADANFLWDRLRQVLAGLVQDTYAKTPEERPFYTPKERPYGNMSLGNYRILSAELSWPMPAGAEPLHSGNVGEAMGKLFKELGASLTWMWADGCHPHSTFCIGNRSGTIAVHGISRDDGSYLLAVTMFVEKNEEEKRRRN